MFRKANFIFISLIVIFLSFIGLFNYIIDPYEVIHSTPDMLCIDNYPRDMYSTVLKLSKDKKYDYLAIGSSTTNSFINKKIFNNKKTIYMMTEKFDLSNQIESLKFILKIHPEINTIIFPIEYAFYHQQPKQKMNPPIISTKIKYLTIKEISRLLFSVETSKKSIEKTKYILNNNHGTNLLFRNQYESYTEDNTNVEKIAYINVHPKRIYNITKYYSESKYKELGELVNFNNKNLILIIPPYHALAQSILYNVNKYENIENIKRYIVNAFPNAQIIDYAFINKYTKEPLETTYYHVDILHPFGHQHSLFYCTLKHHDKFRNKDIYIELSKENIEAVLKWQRQRLEKYIKENDEYINEFLNYNEIHRDLKIEKTFPVTNNICEDYLKNN